MPIVATSLIGRFGNACFQYCHARALAEQTGAELHTPEWIGEKIFDLPAVGRDISNPIGGYRQDQASLIYTRKRVKEWLKVRPEWVAYLDDWLPSGGIVSHRRVGDYGSLGYVVVSMKSYVDAIRENGMAEHPVQFVSEEEPIRAGILGQFMAFLPDFYRIMKADIIFRGNSSFSWWAATLSDAEVWSPVIDGIPGGIEERDCKFVKGNHPKFANLEFVTDLHLPEE